MTFELKKEPVDPRLAEVLGADAYLQELTYGQLRVAMSQAPTPEEAAEYVAASSLQVGGKPIGVEAMRALPGRLAGRLTDVIMRVAAMHGLNEDSAGKA
jgi:hypothetical protein